MKLLWVCVGGAAGSGARYLIGLWAIERLGRDFPWGTLAVNISGCLLFGVMMRLGERTTWFSPTVLVALTTGVLGGFTTYSTFNAETFQMLQEGRARMAAVYVAATLAGGCVAGATGYLAARASLA